MVRTMEPDRKNINSRKQVKREFLQMSETEYFAPENLKVARDLHRQYREQESKNSKKLKKKMYQKRKSIQQTEIARPCDFDFAFL